MAYGFSLCSTFSKCHFFEFINQFFNQPWPLMKRIVSELFSFFIVLEKLSQKPFAHVMIINVRNLLLG